MDPLGLALELLTALPSLIKAGQDVVGLIESTGAVVAKAQAEGRDLTPEERKIYDDQIDALRAQLHAP